jgi:hypothetical protein
VINSAATSTISPNVTLTLSVPGDKDVVGMRIANDQAPAGSFQAFASNTSWTLPSGDGDHTVQVQFRESDGNLSHVVADAITLDTTVPTADITTPTAPLGTIVITFSELVHGVTGNNIVLRQSTTQAGLSVAMTCQDAAGLPVDCATQPLKTVTLVPTLPLLPAVGYSVTVDPAGISPVITDLPGNPVATTTKTFTF